MNLRFSSLVSRFLKWASKVLKANTIVVYKHYFRRFVAENGDVIAQRMTPATVSAWAQTWHQSQAIARLFKWACTDARILKTNPVAGMKHPPKGQRCRITTPGMEKKILRACKPDLRDLLYAYRETFARPGELRAASWGDLFPKTTPAKLRVALKEGNAIIVLRDYKNRKRRRLPNEPRVILLSPQVGRLIARLMTRDVKDDQKIFRTASGRVWTANALRCRMRRLRRLLNLTPDARGENIVPYTFRHTGATNAAAAGIRDRVLADILGHTETSTTQRYIHLQTGHLRAALKKFWKKKRPD